MGMILVTASDTSHAASLKQFLASVAKYEPGVRVVVYDLGMTRREARSMRRAFPGYEFRKFDYSRHPAHFFVRVNAGEFAWKPAIMWQMLCETQAAVCWMDAGNVLTESLGRLRAALSQSGFYSPRSSGTIADWTHPGMLDYFGCDTQWGKDKVNLNGACVAFDPRFERAQGLARKWNEGALIKRCIAPPGSDRSNHRQDQALLSVLAHIDGLAVTSETEFLGFLVQQDRPRPWIERAIRRLTNLLAWTIADFPRLRRLLG
jgi:Protein of unknown function (DUF1647)